MRILNRDKFDQAYDEVVVGNHFFEDATYYEIYRNRYWRTLHYICELPIPSPARILEIGGGQIALLAHRLFKDSCTLADVSSDYSDAVTNFGIDFISCDLLHDEPSIHHEYDLVVLCEVMEHLPVPPHLVLAKIRSWIKPNGMLLLTTPNLYRLRNVIRLALGMPVFCNFFYPKRGSSIGHPIEYSTDHVRWQLEQAGFVDSHIDCVQLSNAGASTLARIGRTVLSPLLLVPRWRDNLVAWARNPDEVTPNSSLDTIPELVKESVPQVH